MHDGVCWSAFAEHADASARRFLADPPMCEPGNRTGGGVRCEDSRAMASYELLDEAGNVVDPFGPVEYPIQWWGIFRGFYRGRQDPSVLQEPRTGGFQHEGEMDFVRCLPDRVPCMSDSGHRHRDGERLGQLDEASFVRERFVAPP